MEVNGKEASYSFLELSRPTGKYVARFFIRLVNIFMEKHFFRYIGNSCTPAIVMSNIDKKAGIQQFGTSKRNCGLIITNVFGTEPVSDGIVIPADPFMIIHIRKSWKSFEDYKSAMSSKYRIRTNRVYTLSESVSKRNLNDEGLEKWIPKCAELLFDTLKNKTITIGRDLNLVLRIFHEVLEENYQVNGYFKGDTLIGFISFVKDENNIFALHLGYDIANGTQLHLYQRMMYDLIDYCIEYKIESLNLGRTAPEIKSTMGAIPVDNSFVFFSRKRISSHILNYYKNNYHKELEYTLRHPFKNGE